MSMMAAQPAFTPVAARRTLATPVVAAPAPTPAGFDQSVVEYVQRAFFEYNRVKDTPAFQTVTSDDMKAKLTAVVSEGQKQGPGGRDWASYPLPHQIIVEERQRAALYIAQHNVFSNIAHRHPGPAQSLASPYQDSTPRKRKSSQPETFDGETDTTPPWKKKQTGSKAGLADRITGKSKHPETKRKDSGSKAQVKSFDISDDALERRRQRFGYVSPEPTPTISREATLTAALGTGPIVGTCQTLEKNYFRLTAPPNPDTVRPLLVLEKALDLIISKWKAKHDYTYFCDQMKSMRQDLTVQRIKNEFTIRVYELHARIALEMKDLGEYNQCQTQLRALYKLKLRSGGNSSGLVGNPDEFTAYRILYLIYTCNRTDMNNMLADLTPADKKGHFVQHALKVRAALAAGNYHRFFTLYAESQEAKWNMVPYLMDMFIERERVAALAAICKAYKPDISIDDLARELAFDCDEGESFFSDDTAQRCYEFLCKYGGEPLVVRKDDSTRFMSGKAGAQFEEAKKRAFSKVDIKGQI